MNYKTDILVVMVTEGPDALLLLPRRSKRTFRGTGEQESEPKTDSEGQVCAQEGLGSRSVFFLLDICTGSGPFSHLCC